MTLPVSQRPTPDSDLSTTVRAAQARAEEFARLPVAERARLVGELVPAVRAVAGEWVEAACRAKGLDARSQRAAEEWISGPFITIRSFRLLHETLAEIARSGRPPMPRLIVRADGRVAVQVFPTSALDATLFAGFAVRTLMQPGLDEHAVRERQASHYRQGERRPSVALVLGAGNVDSIAPTDSIHKMFAEGRVVILKMNPVNEYLGPILERALRPLIERGYLHIVYGGGDTGQKLVGDPRIDDIHITGSDKTHDLIVWGPPGPERERRKRDNHPLLKKSITSELGNVSPMLIVPGRYSDSELWFVARSFATMIENNASFNCNATKVMVLSSSWPQAGLFRDLLRKALRGMPPRKAYYPGAFDRYRALTSGHDVEKFGEERDGTLPWTYIRGLDPDSESEPLFRTEPFCSILSEVALGASEPEDFLAAATRFCNERLWGTLNAGIIIHPDTEKHPGAVAALERSVLDLRYGTVAINHWPAIGYALSSPPWGGHPSSSLQDIQSGIGWVHNTYLLDGIEKSVVRAPLVVRPYPPWFQDSRTALAVTRRMADMEAAPSWLKLPAIALAALRG